MSLTLTLTNDKSAATRLAQVALGQVQVGELGVRARAQHQRAQVPRLALQQRARHRRRACSPAHNCARMVDVANARHASAMGLRQIPDKAVLVGA